jgi:hypothetical protein
MSDRRDLSVKSADVATLPLVSRRNISERTRRRAVERQYAFRKILGKDCSYRPLQPRASPPRWH